MMRTGLHLIRAAFLGAPLAAPAAADPGWFTGLDVGVSEPTNGNYRAHVRSGATVNPYLGYMFHDNIGIQSQLHFAFHITNHWALSAFGRWNRAWQSPRPIADNSNPEGRARNRRIDPRVEE